MFPRYQAEVFGGFIDHAHNDYLQFFMEIGLAAPVIVALALAAYVMRMSELLRGQTKRSFIVLQIAAGVGLLPMILHSMFDFAIHMPANAMWFATLAGVMFHAGVEDAAGAEGALATAARTGATGACAARKRRARRTGGVDIAARPRHRRSPRAAMIDLHCHMLPGIDDGAPDEATSLEMARIAVADGIETTACTPHIYPGLYENDAAGIKTRVKALQSRLLDEGIALKLTIGADAHLTPELLGRLQGGHGTVACRRPLFPARAAAHGCAAAVCRIDVRFRRGRVRAGADPPRAPFVDQAALRGVRCARQNRRVDADHRGEPQRSLRRSGASTSARRCSTRVSCTSSPPTRTACGTARRCSRKAELAAEKYVGKDEARRLVVDRPQAILDNRPQREVEPVPALRDPGHGDSGGGFLSRVLGRVRRK